MMRVKLIALLTLFVLGFSLNTMAKDGKKEKSEVTFLVSMTCENCQKRIENNIAFEKGVTALNVNLPDKLVTIEYRKDKTSPEKLKEAIQKLGYTATPFHPKKKAEKE